MDYSIERFNAAWPLKNLYQRVLNMLPSGVGMGGGGGGGGGWSPPLFLVEPPYFWPLPKCVLCWEIEFCILLKLEPPPPSRITFLRHCTHFVINSFFLCKGAVLTRE